MSPITYSDIFKTLQHQKALVKCSAQERFALLGSQVTYPTHTILPCDPFSDLAFAPDSRLSDLSNADVNAHQIPLKNARKLTFSLSSHPRITARCGQASDVRSIQLLSALFFRQKVTHMIDLTNQGDQLRATQAVIPYCPKTHGSISLKFNNVTLTIENIGPARGAPYFTLCTATLQEGDQPPRAHAFHYYQFSDWNDHQGGAIHKITQLALLLASLKNAAINLHCRAGVGRSGSLLTLVIALLNMQMDPTSWKSPAVRTHRLAAILLFVRYYRSADVVQNSLQFATIERCADCAMYMTDFRAIFEDTPSSWEAFKGLKGSAIIVTSKQVEPFNPEDTGLTLLVPKGDQPIEQHLHYDRDMTAYWLQDPQIRHLRFRTCDEMLTVLKFWQPTVNLSLQLYNPEAFLHTCSAQNPQFQGAFKRDIQPYMRLFQDSSTTFLIRETNQVAHPAPGTTGYAIVFKQSATQLASTLINIGEPYSIDTLQGLVTFTTLTDLSQQMSHTLKTTVTQFTPQTCLDMISYLPLPKC